MANVYIDLDLATGTNAGTSWANAFQTFQEISAVSSGDDVWIKGTQSHSGGTIDETIGTDAQNPVKIIGVKSATTNEPPIQSDLIPGWRTGEAQTIANRAYKDADAPTLTITDTSLFQTRGFFYIYGFNIVSGGEMRLAITGNMFWEECFFESNGVGDLVLPRGGDKVRLKNCGYETNNAANQISGLSGIAEIIGLEYIGTVASTAGFFSPSNTNMIVIGGDFNDLGANPLFLLSTTDFCQVWNSRLNASAVIVSGSLPDSGIRVEAHHCSSVTGKSSGTVLNVDIATESGNITEETTAIRTGGANDGTSGYSLAFTPGVDGTRDNYLGLIGPWMAFKITGDGTSQTVSVYIANSGAGDYNDDDVWLEVMYPSEGGTAQYDNVSTQMDLLDTPAAVTDDTGSTWGTGANNHQILQASIAPDYVGHAYCRVVFAKNFGASPETLYVDPLPVVS